MPSRLLAEDAIGLSTDRTETPTDPVVPNAKPTFVAARFPNYESEAPAALQGIGAALLSPLRFAQFITQGALVAPFPCAVEGPNSYWLLWTQESADTHFVGWMKTQFGISADVRD